MYGLILKQAFGRGTICCAGDLTCQYLEGQKEINIYRTIGFFGYGFTSSPIMYKTFEYLNRMNGITNFGVLKTAVIYETLFWPSTMMPLLYANLEIAKGKTINQAMEKMKEEGLVLAITSASIWIPTTFIQQKYIPMRNMILFRSACCSLSAVAMSYYTNQNAELKRQI